MAYANSIAGVILGEAAGQETKQDITEEERFDEMVAIASAIANRAAALNTTPEKVIANSKEFNAYGSKLDSSKEMYRSLAQRAWDFVQQFGPTHKALFYATPNAVKGLPASVRNLPEVARTVGHAYYGTPSELAGKTIAIEGGVTRTIKDVEIATTNTTGLKGQEELYAALTGRAAAKANPAVDEDMPLISDKLNFKSVPDYAFAGGVPQKIGGKYNTYATGKNYDQGQVRDELKSMVNYALQKVNAPVTAYGVISGMRTPGYNTAVAYNNEKLTGSLHQPDEEGLGRAMDIDMTGMSDSQRRQLVSELTSAGIGRIGLYSKNPNMMHVDLGKRDAKDPHFMFDMSASNMKNAPSWYQEIAALGGFELPQIGPMPTFRDNVPPANAYDEAGIFTGPSTYDEAGVGGQITDADLSTKGASVPPPADAPSLSGVMGGLGPDYQSMSFGGPDPRQPAGTYEYGVPSDSWENLFSDVTVPGSVGAMASPLEGQRVGMVERGQLPSMEDIQKSNERAAAERAIWAGQAGLNGLIDPELNQQLQDRIGPKPQTLNYLSGAMGGLAPAPVPSFPTFEGKAKDDLVMGSWEDAFKPAPAVPTPQWAPRDRPVPQAPASRGLLSPAADKGAVDLTAADVLGGAMQRMGEGFRKSTEDLGPFDATTYKDFDGNDISRSEYERTHTGLDYTTPQWASDNVNQRPTPQRAPTGSYEYGLSQSGYNGRDSVDNWNASAQGWANVPQAKSYENDPYRSAGDYGVPEPSYAAPQPYTENYAYTQQISPSVRSAGTYEYNVAAGQPTSRGVTTASASAPAAASVSSFPGKEKDDYVGPTGSYDQAGLQYTNTEAQAKASTPQTALVNALAGKPTYATAANPEQASVKGQLLANASYTPPQQVAVPTPSPIKGSVTNVGVVAGKPLNQITYGNPPGPRTLLQALPSVAGRPPAFSPTSVNGQVLQERWAQNPDLRAQFDNVYEDYYNAEVAKARARDALVEAQAGSVGMGGGIPGPAGSHAVQSGGTGGRNGEGYAVSSTYGNDRANREMGLQPGMYTVTNSYGVTTVNRDQGGSVASSGTAGGPGGTYLCTAFLNLGELSKEVWRLDALHGGRLRRDDPAVYYGYALWAEPLSRFILGHGVVNRVARAIVRPVVLGWAQHVAHKARPDRYRRSLLGTAINSVGVPICRILGAVADTAKGLNYGS